MRISARGIYRSPYTGPLMTVLVLSAFMVVLPLRTRTTISRIGTGSVLLPFLALDRYLQKLDVTFERNRDLNRKLDSLAVMTASLIEYRYENERLRRMLGFNLNLPFNLVPAEIRSVSLSSQIKSIVIDAGSERGIAVNMPVISPSGVVGKTIAVEAKASTVQLLTDPACKIAARVRESRASGIVSHTGGRYLSMTNVPADQRVQVGDSVVSSGLGGIFPQGLFIGTVVKSERKEGELFLEIQIDPGADFSILEEVFVIAPSPE
jgi:rod shape-determining protein MreC